MDIWNIIFYFLNIKGGKEIEVLKFNYEGYEYSVINYLKKIFVIVFLL